MFQNLSLSNYAGRRIKIWKICNKFVSRHHIDWQLTYLLVTKIWSRWFRTHIHLMDFPFSIFYGIFNIHQFFLWNIKMCQLVKQTQCFVWVWGSTQGSWFLVFNLNPTISNTKFYYFWHIFGLKKILKQLQWYFVIRINRITTTPPHYQTCTIICKVQQ